MRTWVGAALVAASVSLGGAFTTAPALAASPAKTAVQDKAPLTDFSSQHWRGHRHHHFGHRHWRHHRHWGHRHYGFRPYYGPRYGYGYRPYYGPRYGYGYRPVYRSYYAPSYYGGYGYRPYGYRPYGAYGYGPRFGGGPISVGFSFGGW